MSWSVFWWFYIPVVLVFMIASLVVNSMAKKGGFSPAVYTAPWRIVLLSMLVMILPAWLFTYFMNQGAALPAVVIGLCSIIVELYLFHELGRFLRR